jgi:hypothetical protein
VSAAAELESLLQSDTLSSDDRLLIMEAIVDFKSKPRSKSSELKKARIVGCTCASLTKSIMDDQQFDIVIVDEATQLVEPMVLVPCVRFGCKAMILAGDINQLPPTLAGRTDADAGSKHPMDLSKTLFQRLSFMGIEPIFLNIQYVSLAIFIKMESLPVSGIGCILQSATYPTPYFTIAHWLTVSRMRIAPRLFLAPLRQLFWTSVAGVFAHAASLNLLIQP